MRRSLWSLVLCVGVAAAALIETRSIEAQRPGTDERPPVEAVCTADPADQEAELMCGKCGDGYCNPRCGETSASCPKDCGGATS